MVNVSVIIVNYHSEKLIANCVQSIKEKTTGITYQIIIVDNESRPDGVVYLEQNLGNDVLIVPSEKNLGFGKANNLGAERAEGKYLLLLNPDTILDNNAIKILFDYMESSMNTGVSGGNLYTENREPAPSFSLQFDDLRIEKAEASWFFIIKEKIRQKVGRSDAGKWFNFGKTPLKVGYIFGTDMMIPRQLYRETGGFDPDFFMYAEEEELSWRITEKGYDIVNVPSARIIHLDGGTQKTGGVFNQRQFCMRMNGILTYYYKRYGLKGVKAFYRFRMKRYKRLLMISRIRGKQTGKTIAYKLLQCLQHEYDQFISQHRQIG